MNEREIIQEKIDYYKEKIRYREQWLKQEQEKLISLEERHKILTEIYKNKSIREYDEELNYSIEDNEKIQKHVKRYIGWWEGDLKRYKPALQAYQIYLETLSITNPNIKGFFKRIWEKIS